MVAQVVIEHAGMDAADISLVPPSSISARSRSLTELNAPKSLEVAGNEPSPVTLLQEASRPSTASSVM
jgi:hypothetical protein